MELLMETKGIRILDKENNHVSVDLKDILVEIDGEQFNWSMLYFDGMGHLGKWGTIPDFEEMVNESENGLFISWKDLNELANLFREIIDIIIIGCKDTKQLMRYEEDEKMYRSCDIVIVKFDSCFWEVFAYDQQLIKRFSKKFNKIKWLEPDFEK